MRLDERGEQAGGDGFYVAFNGAPYELALLSRALERRPDRRLALLPVGSATREELGELEVEAPAGSLRLRHVAITGLGFAPTSLWVDEEGELFAVADAWFSLVRAGWEDVAGEQVARQREASTKRWREVAASVARRPAGALYRELGVAPEP